MRACAYNADAVTKKVFFDINIGDKEAGRVTIGLYAEKVPKTAEVRVALRHLQLRWKKCSSVACSN